MRGVIERGDRSVLRMYGRDPVKMIQGLATNDIAGAAVNVSVYTAFLTPKGKMIGDARVVRRENGDVWIEADRAAAENIAANFRKTIPPLFARFETIENIAVFDVIGEDVAVAAEAVLSNPFRTDARTYLVTGDKIQEARDLFARSNLQALSPEEVEVLRIEVGEPKWGAELNEDVIPLEAGLRRIAISESKGCYTGQEVIVRILHRGHVNRHLRGLLTGDAMAAVGAVVMSGEKNVGKVTSACYSRALGQAIALGYVRREVEPGSEV